MIEYAQLAITLRRLFNLLSESTNNLLRETMLFDVLTRLMVKYGKSRMSFKLVPLCDRRLELVRQFIHDNLEHNISLEDLSLLSGIAPFYLVIPFALNKC